MKLQTILYGLILVFPLFSCGNDHSVETTDLSHAGHWGYQGQEAPEHWAELSAEFVKCAEGHFQSPIDIESYSAKEYSGPLLDFRYHPSPVDLVNNGHTVQANLEEENVLVVHEQPYSLKQIHFHEPSEHQVDGVIYPMEMHLVHTDSTGQLAVVGILIKEGQENKDLQALWDALPEHKEEHYHPNGRCDIVHLLPQNKSVFHYSGSLTTPPCTEGVDWYVMKEAITLSKAQINKFRHLYHKNNRPVQQSEARTIEVSTN